MDPIEQLKDDVQSGRIEANRLVDLLVTVQRELQAAKQRITALEQRNAELEQQLSASSGTSNSRRALDSLEKLALVRRLS